MASQFAARLGAPTGRVSLFYFSMFMVPAVANPYFPIWLTDLGFTEAQIGTVSATPIFLMIILNLWVGRIADKASDWRQVIIFGAIFACMAPIALFFAEGYWSILIIWSMVIVPFQAIMPVMDAATLRLLKRINGDFGRVRLWGTAGFMIITVPAGLFLDWYGPQVFVPAILALSILRALTSLQLPYFRGDPGAAPKSEVEPLGEIQRISPLVATRLKEVWRPWFILPLIAAALLHGSHMLQMSFGALLWLQQGISAAVIGPLWAVAPAGEILVMLYFSKIATRFSARHLILMSAGFAMLRWVGFAMEPPLWGYAMLQLLHLGSYALGYMGVVNFITNWTSEDIAAQAQSVFVGIRQVVTVIALGSFGFLVGGLGSQAFYVAAGIAMLGGVMVLLSLALMSPKREQAEQTS